MDINSDHNTLASRLSKKPSGASSSFTTGIENGYLKPDEEFEINILPLVVSNKMAASKLPTNFLSLTGLLTEKAVSAIQFT